MWTRAPVELTRQPITINTEPAYAMQDLLVFRATNDTKSYLSARWLTGEQPHFLQLNKAAWPWQNFK